jgi:hypothetical protein
MVLQAASKVATAIARAVLVKRTCVMKIPEGENAEIRMMAAAHDCCVTLR